MKCARFYGIHDIRPEEIDKPVCGGKEVLIKVAYAGICGSDLHIYNKGMFIQNIPETMGHEFVGVVEEIGSGVAEYQPGDYVTADPMVPCGHCISCQNGSYNTCEELGFIGEVRPGCFAEYIVMPEEKLIPVPKASNLRSMALTEPLAVALHICERAQFRAEDRIAVIGAGPIGLLTIIAARSIYGVQDITAVDISDTRLELAETVGAADVTKKLKEDRLFDKVIEAAGNPHTLKLAAEHVMPNGKLYVVSIFEENTEFDINRLVASQITLVGCNVYTREDLIRAVKAISEGEVEVDPLISGEFDLTQCAEAFRILSLKNKSAAKILFKM